MGAFGALRKGYPENIRNNALLYTNFRYVQLIPRNDYIKVAVENCNKLVYALISLKSKSSFREGYSCRSLVFKSAVFKKKQRLLFDINDEFCNG